MTDASAARAPSPPRVLVLLAVYNGRTYLPEQVDSILAQRGAEVRILVSDDGSTDGSVDWLRTRAGSGDPITFLPTIAPTGSAAANFRRLLRDATPGPGELVAFADQDDVWHPGKFARHAALIAGGADAVSSNVTAVDETGQRTLVKKDWPQRRWDFLTEAAGPGCSHLFSPGAFELLQRVVTEVPEVAETDFHDWLSYVALRAAGRRWVIDAEPSLDYRQHAGNVIGANQGTRAAAKRLGMIRSHWHRDQAALNARIALQVAERVAPGPSAVDTDALRTILGLLEDTGPRARVRLARGAGTLRRRPRDREVLRTLVLTGVW